jgi:hypothetical protein
MSTLHAALVLLVPSLAPMAPLVVIFVLLNPTACLRPVLARLVCLLCLFIFLNFDF